MKPSTLLIAAAALFSMTNLALPARADELTEEMARLHARCEEGNTHACIRFGFRLCEHRDRHSEWRHDHPDWWRWE